MTKITWDSLLLPPSPLSLFLMTPFTHKKWTPYLLYFTHPATTFWWFHLHGNRFDAEPTGKWFLNNKMHLLLRPCPIPQGSLHKRSCTVGLYEVHDWGRIPKPWHTTPYRPPYTTVTHETSVPQPLTTKMTCFSCLNSWHFHWFVEVLIKHESFHGKTGPQNWGTKPNSSSKSSWQIPGSTTCHFSLAVFISCLKFENTQKGWKKQPTNGATWFLSTNHWSLFLKPELFWLIFCWHKMAGWWQKFQRVPLEPSFCHQIGSHGFPSGIVRLPCNQTNSSHQLPS